MSRMNESAGKQGGEKATDVMQGARDLGNQVKDAAREQYDHLKDQAQEYYQQGREKVDEYRESIEQYVQDQPVKALLIAAGVGMLLGILWKRS